MCLVRLNQARLQIALNLPPTLFKDRSDRFVARPLINRWLFPQ